MRQIDIFLKNSNGQQCWFTCFVRIVNLKLFCKSANQNKNNFRFTTLTKHVNNQTNCCNALKNWRKYGAVSYLFSCKKTFYGIHPIHKQAVINVSSCSISGLSAIKNHSSLFIDRGILNILTSCVGCKVTWG